MEELNETLLDKAEQNIKCAEAIRQAALTGSGDEALFNYVGYHLQQAAEMAIKYQLELNGVAYPKIHDLEDLIALADVAGADLGNDDFIREHCDQLTRWESKTRYILNYHLAMQKTEDALKKIKEYIADTKDRITAMEKNEWT